MAVIKMDPEDIKALDKLLVELESSGRALVIPGDWKIEYLEPSSEEQGADVEPTVGTGENE